MKTLIPGVLFLGLISLAWGAKAEESAEPAIVTGDDLLEEVTVYGTSNSMRIIDYPGQVSVRGLEEVELFMPTTISELLRDVPGLEFSGGPRRTGETPSIRGLGRENVLILIDGARQSFISAHDGRFFLDPDLISTAEVVRGPSSALYGSGAVGGVMAFETLDAADLLKSNEGIGLRLRAGYQDVNEETNGSATAYMRQGRLDLIGSLSFRDSGDIELGSGDTLPSDDDLTSGLIKAEYALSDAWGIEASWLQFNNDAVEPNNGQGVTLSEDDVLSTLVDKRIESDNYRLTTKFRPIDSIWLDAALTLYRADTDVKESELDSPRSTTRRIETTGVSLRNVSRLGRNENHLLTLGGDWFEDEQTGEDSANVDGTRNGVPDGEGSFIGFFAQFESVFEKPLGLPGELLVIPGIRYDEYENESDILPGEEQDDDAVSPRLGLSYGPVPWFRAFANYAEAFRAPSINELYLDGTHFELPHPILGGSGVFISNEFVPNPLLTAEESETIELGIGLDFANILTEGDSLLLKTSYYESEVDDLIDLNVDFGFDSTCFIPPFLPCSAGTSNSANVDEAEFDGYELEASYDADRFFALLTFSTIDGEDKSDGSDLGILTPDRLNLDLRWRIPSARAALGTRMQYADNFRRQAFDDDGNSITVDQRDSYTVFDIYATWQPGFLPGIRLDVSVDNVSDEDYERVFAGVSEPGRNLKFAITWQGDF
ncbi:MAG: TonB-dependent hemoglobin/transferrin/lactoferrin family receptor [Pseudomonadota bacterium]